MTRIFARGGHQRWRSRRVAPIRDQEPCRDDEQEEGADDDGAKRRLCQHRRVAEYTGEKRRRETDRRVAREILHGRLQHDRRRRIDIRCQLFLDHGQPRHERYADDGERCSVNDDMAAASEMVSQRRPRWTAAAANHCPASRNPT